MVLFLLYCVVALRHSLVCVIHGVRWISYRTFLSTSTLKDRTFVYRFRIASKTFCSPSPGVPVFFFLTIGFDDYRNRLPEGTGIIYRFDFRSSASYISSSILIRYGTRLCYWCPCISLCVHVRVCAAPLLKEQMSCVSLAGCLV